MITQVVLDVLASRDVQLPPDSLAELTEIVLEEASTFGSATDVHDAVGHLLPSNQAAALSESLFVALKAKRGPGRARLLPVSGSELPASGTEPGSSAEGFLERLSWAREYKSHAERFERPYLYEMPGTTLTLQQRPFDAEGFASTVWDSAIVLSKALERLEPSALQGTSACELGAGCGLPGLVLAARGARVLLSDLSANLPLLEDNCRSNAHAWSEAPATCALAWGAPPPRSAPFDLVVGTDLFYAREAMGLLVDTLVSISGPATVVWLAAGRNRQAAEEFWPLAEKRFSVESVPLVELDPVFNLEAVGMWRLRLRAGGAEHE